MGCSIPAKRRPTIGARVQYVLKLKDGFNASAPGTSPITTTGCQLGNLDGFMMESREFEAPGVSFRGNTAPPRNPRDRRQRRTLIEKGPERRAQPFNLVEYLHAGRKNLHTRLVGGKYRKHRTIRSISRPGGRNSSTRFRTARRFAKFEGIGGQNPND